MDYEELLKNAPPHDTEEFLQYLRDNNPVAWENDSWLCIQNFKYPTWLTIFKKNITFRPAFEHIPAEYWSWEWRKKPADKQTVKRFHLHLIPPEK